MVDEVVVNPAPTAPAPAETVVAPVVTAPVIDTNPVPAAPTVEATPTVEAAPVVEPVKETPKETPSLLNEANKPVVEAPKVDAPAEPVIDSKQSVEPAPLPTYEPWQLPEHVSPEDEKVKTFTSQLAQFESLTKADHAEVQKFGQELLSFHVAEQAKAVESVVKSIQEGWEKQKNDWRSEVTNDPIIGGEKLAATLTSANQLLNTHAPKTGAEFRNLMETSGYGNHPVILRFLSEVSGSMSEGKPLPATKPVSAPTSKTQKFYGSK